MTDISQRNLRRYGAEKGVYNGATKRRFVLFVPLMNGNVQRQEYDTKSERDAAARKFIWSAIETE